MISFVHSTLILTGDDGSQNLYDNSNIPTTSRRATLAQIGKNVGGSGSGRLEKRYTEQFLKYKNALIFRLKQIMIKKKL